MENTSIILFIAIVTPLAMMLLIFKNESKTVLAFLLVGMFSCLLSGEVNGLLLSLNHFDSYFLTINIAPIVEEITKALPILFFAFVFCPKKQLLLECAIAVGVGFAVLENAYIIALGNSTSLFLAIIRGFGAGLMHGISTLCVGYGMTYVHVRRKLFWTGTIALLTVAISYHSIYNVLIQSPYYIVGLLLPIATFLPISIYLRNEQRQKMK